MDARTKRTFQFVFVTLLVDLLAFTLILPLLPKILDYYANHDKSHIYKMFNDCVKTLQILFGIPDSHNQVLLAGVLGSWFSLLQFVSSPFMGALSDKFGRKNVLLMAMSGSVMSYAIWFIASDDFGLFILSRTVGGLSKANVGLSLAMISDVSTDETRGKGMAIVGSSFSLAFIFGPSIGALLSTYAKGDDSMLQDQLITNPALIAMFLSLFNFALAVLLLEETNSKRKSVEDLRKRRVEKHESLIAKSFHFVNPYSLFKFNLVQRTSQPEIEILRTTGSVYFYYLLFYSGLEFTLSFLTHLRFKFSSIDQSKLYLFSGILMALVQGGYIRRMKSGSEALIALLGLVMIIPSYIVMGLSTRVSHIYYSLTLYAISSAVVVPCLTTVISNHCPAGSRGVAMGTFRSIGALARAFGPILASLLFWTFGPTVCYVGGALALFIPLIKLGNSYSQLKRINGKQPTPKLMLKNQVAKAN